MSYEKLRTLYPSIDRMMERIQASIAAGLDPEAVLALGLGQIGKIKNPQHRAVASGKVKEFWVVMGGRHGPNIVSDKAD